MISFFFFFLKKKKLRKKKKRKSNKLRLSAQRFQNLSANDDASTLLLQRMDIWKADGTLYLCTNKYWNRPPKYMYETKSGL